jgi:hypothetical protein
MPSRSHFAGWIVPALIGMMLSPSTGATQKPPEAAQALLQAGQREAKARRRPVLVLFDASW